jgi:phosphate transport system substrate-binding protein
MNNAITKAHPEFQLRYTEPLNTSPGTDSGIAMLIDEQLSFSHGGRPLKDAELNKALSRGFKLEQVPIALDGLALYTHPELDLQGLSIAQLQNIFLGKITNWSEVGGPDLEIVPITFDPKKIGTLFNLLFEGKKDAKLGSNVRTFRDFTACIRVVAATPGAISFTSASIVNQQKSVRLLAIAKDNSNPYISPVSENGQTNVTAFRDGTYPLTRRLFVFLRRDGSIDEQAGVAYANFVLSKEGQRIVKKAGFVPLRQVD